jgi:plasmid stabilization system protein ParE
VKVSLAPEAAQELMEGALFYARQANPGLGERFITEFERCAALLAEQPKLGAVWRGAVRRFPLRRFPYNIIYSLGIAELRVIAVAHQSRKPGFWRSRA